MKAPAVFLVAFWSLATASVGAAPAGPSLAYGYPAGAQAGTTVRITVAGQLLKNTLGVMVSGTGVRAQAVAYTSGQGPLTDLQEEELKRLVAELRDRNTALAKKLPVADPGTPLTDLPDLPELKDLGKRTNAQLDLVHEFFLNRATRAKPPMDETVTVEVTLDAGATPGTRELRLWTGAGLTNPLVFRVGVVAEVREPDRAARIAGLVPAPVSLPAVWNGQVMPGETDTLAISLVRGQEVGVAVAARALIPYLADAVPGWFQAFVAVAGPDGRVLTWADDTAIDPDPRLVFTAPADGVYTLSVRDALYRGRRDFVYRVSLGGPEVTNPVPLAEPGPGWLPGTLARAGQVDRYPVRGTAGQDFVAEVRARRDGSPVDSLVRIVDATGKVLAWNDDFEDRSAGLVTHQADSWLRFRWPADGDYRVEVSEAQGQGGPDYFYRLRAGAPVPGFSLATTRSALNLAPGGQTVFTVQAFRQNGWDGPIAVALRDAPPGFTLEGGPVPPGKTSVDLTLRAPKKAWDGPQEVHLEGSATVGGSLMVRPVAPCDAQMQAFATTHLVPAQGLWVSPVRR